MAKRRAVGGTALFAGVARRSKRALVLSTALQSTGLVLLAFPAAAQLAPQARPQGGVVSAGQASINQNTAQTTVNQTSQRAVVDWRSFDVGSQHTVAFQQPGASAITLNRVAGPDPSQIAGRITANGQVAIVNGSGVVFQPGSVVDVQSLVVSSANISNKNFMAGRRSAGQLVFDQPGRPDARISNAGTITVKQGGLAALVAPQVANSGVIAARMGKVILAGAEAHTIDLYGDGLMSIDVTRQVRQAPNGGTALVTNTGTIAADGGTVVLTAQAVDGMVSNLINAGGKIRANSLPGHPGSIVMRGVGGSLSVDGEARADGSGAEMAGGSIELIGTDRTTISSTARLSATGRGGGGTISIGTTLARAQSQTAKQPTPDNTAREVVVQPGSNVSVNGRGGGSGGRVAILSKQNTRMNGAVTAIGGPQGGNGGAVEISGDQAVSLSGTVNVTAAKGKPGSILIDPVDLYIGDTDPGSTPASTASPNTTNQFVSTSGLSGSVTLSATEDVFVTSAISNDGITSLNLSAGRAMDIGGAINLRFGTVSLTAESALRVQASISAVNSLSITNNSRNPSNQGVNPPASDQLGLFVSAPLSVSGQGGNIGTINVEAYGPYRYSANANISAPNGTINLKGSGTYNFADLPNLNAANLNLQAGDITLGRIFAPGASVNIQAMQGGIKQASGSVITSNNLTVSTNSGNPSPNVTVNTDVSLTGNNQVSTFSYFSNATGNLSFNNQADVTLLGSISARNVSLSSGGNIIQGYQNTITATTLSGSAGGSASFINSNSINNLDSFSASGGFSLKNYGNLIINGAIRSSDASFSSTGGSIMQTTGSVINARTLSASAYSGIALTGSNQVDTVNQLMTGGNVAFTNVGSFAIGGSVAASSFGSIGLISKNGSISQSTGSVISGGALGGSASGSASLTGNNQIDGVNGFTVGSDFTLIDGRNLAVLGQGISASGRTIAIATDALTFGNQTSPAGTISVPGGTFALAPHTPNRSVSITDVSSSNIIAGTRALGSLDGGQTVLAGSITSPSSALSFDGNLLLYSNGAVTLYAPVSVRSAKTIGIQADSLVFSSDVLPGSLSALGGTVAYAPNTIGLSASLSNLPTDRVIAGTFALGSVDNGRTMRAGSISLPGTPTTYDANLNLYATNTVTVNAPLAVTSGKTIAVETDTLAFTAGQLSAPRGTIAYAPYTTGRTISLPDFASSRIAAGTLAVGSIDGGATVTAGSITIPATVSLGATNLALYSTGDIAESGGGTIATSGSLSGQAGGSVNLTGQNQIATLGNLSANGTIRVAEAPNTTLTVAGTLTAAGIGLQADTILYNGGAINVGTGTAALAPATQGAAFQIPSLANITAGTLAVGSIDGGATVAAGSITIPAIVSLGATNLAVYSTGDIAESGGGTIATSGSLSGQAGGSVNLTGQNQITTLGNLSANGTIRVAEGPNTTLAVAGTLTAAGVGLQADTILYNGGAINVGTGTAALAPATQGAAFQIPLLANITAGTLAVGSIDGGATVTAGSITIPATVFLGATNLALYSTGDIAESGGGTIATSGFLSGQAGGSVNLTGQNQIATLGNLSANGTIRVAEAPNTTLTVAGTLTAAGVALVADALDYSNGTINVGGGTVAIAPSTPGQPFSIPSLTNITAGTLAVGSVDNGATVTAGSINIPSLVSLGATNLALYATGNITETGAGAIVTTGTLSGQAGGAASLAGANQIATLGNFAAGTGAGGGNLQLTDNSALAVTGVVSSAGDLSLTGSPSVTTRPGSLLSASRTMTITVQNGSVELAGTLSAPKIAVLAPFTTLVGGTIATGGNIIPADAPIESLPTFYNSAAGAFFAANQFTQRGTTQIVALNGYARATVRVDLDPVSASIQSLDGPLANLIINPNGGRVSLGQVNVARLNVLNSFSLGSTELITFATGSSRAVALPSLNPLKDVSLAFFGNQDEEDLIVPNISDQGM